jgi:hypothetical protein
MRGYTKKEEDEEEEEEEEELNKRGGPYLVTQCARFRIWV